jgi:hypothetical protein
MRELGGIQLAAVALAAGRATAAGLNDAASDCAQRAHMLTETTWPTGMSLAELCLCIHRGLVVSGDKSAASLVVERAVQWIESQALPNVPADFKDSFLTRNPAHRAVLAGMARVQRR